jgi:uncharacterized SAM-binding protein YcdF (DUF218 family)
MAFALAAAVLPAAMLWAARQPLLTRLGALLVAEDPLVPATVLVVSHASGRAAALEAARLHGQGTAPRILLFTWARDPVDDEVVRLGARFLPTTELLVDILVRSGVPADAIAVGPEPVDGLGSEVAAVARFAAEQRPASLLFITDRAHSARARWLLRRQVPSATAVAVRSPAIDGFRPDGWWRDRERSRQVVFEYVRWVNTLVLGDALRDRSRPASEAAPAGAPPLSAARSAPR